MLVAFTAVACSLPDLARTCSSPLTCPSSFLCRPSVDVRSSDLRKGDMFKGTVTNVYEYGCLVSAACAFFRLAVSSGG